MDQLWHLVRGDAGEGQGASRDSKWVAEELGDPLPGLPSPHHDAQRCVPGVCGGDAAHHTYWPAESVLTWMHRVSLQVLQRTFLMACILDAQVFVCWGL